MESIHPLKSYRESQSPPLSQEQMAALLGVSKASVSRWETGERKPEQALVPRISAKTGIHPAKLRPDLAGLFSPSARDRRSPRRKTRVAA